MVERSDTTGLRWKGADPGGSRSGVTPPEMVLYRIISHRAGTRYRGAWILIHFPVVALVPRATTGYTL